MSDVKEKGRSVVKTVTHGKLYSDGTILVEDVRCSYPHVFKAAAFEGGEPSYSVVLLLPKAKAYAGVKELIDGQIKAVVAEAKGKMPPADKLFIRDGDATDKPENEGAWTISAREKKRPAVRDADKSVLGAEDSEKIYGGCYISCLIRPWYQDNKYGKRVNANLVAVQFRKDGEPFGEGRISDAEIDDTFDEVEDDDI